MGRLGRFITFVGLGMSGAARLSGGAEAPVEDAPAGYEEAVEADKVQVPAVGGFAGAGVIVNPVDNGEDAPEIAAFQQQVRPTVLGWMKYELAFARRVCEPNPEVDRQFVEAAKRAVLETSLAWARGQRAGMNGQGVRFLRAGGMAQIMPNAQMNPRRILLETFRTALFPLLDADVRERYQAETADRDQLSRRATVEILVASMDGQLYLSQPQREAIVKSLTENWQDDWEGAQQIIINNVGYLPQIPDPLVIPHLNKTQARIWRQSPKVHAGSAIDFQMDGDRLDDLDEVDPFAADGAVQ